MDDRRGGFFAHPELLDPASTSLRIARERGVLTDTAGQRLEETLETARRDPAQGAKAGAYGLSGAQAILTRGASFVAEHEIAGAAGTTQARRDLEERYETYLQQARPGLPPLLAGMPSDLRYAVERLAESAGTDAFPGKMVHAATPTQPPERAPKFTVKELKRRLRAGEAIPGEWVPLVTSLDLPLQRAKGTLPVLAALTSLRALEISGSRVTDVTPLTGLTALQRLYLNGTGVSDVTPLSHLRGLRIHR